MKLLSIVTINRNDAAGLIKTIQSIKPLLGDDVEHVIVDGASTDDSVAQAQALLAGQDAVTLVSERDTGIYNAMNKGLALSSGRYVAFVNSGDELMAEPYRAYLKDVAKLDADVYYSRTFVHPEDAGAPPFVHERHPSQFRNDTIPHLTTAVRRDVLLAHGGFDEQYRVVADRDLFIRLHKAGAKFAFHDGVVARFYLGGVSSGVATKREDALVNVRHGHITKASYYRKLFRLWLKSRREAI